MRYARLNGKKTDIKKLKREKIPYRTEFTCINYECKCRYKANLGEQRKYFSRWGDIEDHSSDCKVKYFDDIKSEPNITNFKPKENFVSRSVWSKTSFNSISQVYEYYLNVLPKEAKNFIIDKNNCRTNIDNDNVYVVKFSTIKYEKSGKKIIGELNNNKEKYNVTFNFKTEDKLSEFISKLLTNNENKIKGATMFYIGHINYYEESKTYFLHSTDKNFEVFVEN